MTEISSNADYGASRPVTAAELAEARRKAREAVKRLTAIIIPDESDTDDVAPNDGSRP